MKFRSLNNRIVAFFALLLLAVQVVAFVFIDSSITHNAKGKTRQELTHGKMIVNRLLEQRGQQLEHAARVLASDFGFRQAVATDDAETINSVIKNHGSRIKADTMMVVALDGSLIADSLNYEIAGKRFEFAALLRAAEEQGHAYGITLVRGRATQLVILPVLAPQPVAWVAIGFVVKDSVAEDLKSLTGLDVSFVSAMHDSPSRLLATTLPAELKDTLLSGLAAAALDKPGSTFTMAVAGDEYESILSSIGTTGAATVLAVLQHSLRASLAPFDRLRAALVGLTLASLIASVIGSMFIARSITRPVSMLAGVARKIEQGDYTSLAEVKRDDEIGDLASAFNHMRDGIAARERKIGDLAYTDGLTGLPNRTLFSDRLQQAINSAKRIQRPLSVLLIDLDRFKYVNDTLGHDVGDLLLKEVALRLRSALPRKSDTLARLGGDEFGVLLPTDDAAGATKVAMRLLEALKEPIALSGHPVDVGGSIGVVSSPEHGEDAATLVRRVDMAMYMAKQSNSGYAIYDPSYDRHSENRLSLMGELRQAVEQNQLTLYYQPKVDLKSGRTRNAEVLVRWQHPQRGFVPPDQFIPFAEQTGYIRSVTRWIVNEALRQCAEWRNAGVDIELAVNISARDLFDPDLVTVMSGMLAAHGASPDWLSLEITESAIMDDPDKALQTVERLHAMGFKLSIDDFGTGYSSLGYLKRLPVDELKIDRSFVKDMAADADDATIVRSTVELAHNMGLKVVAEGVEDQASYDLLGTLGCDYGQGYFMGRPQPAEQFGRWLQESPWGAPAASEQPPPAENVVPLIRASSRTAA